MGLTNHEKRNGFVESMEAQLWLSSHLPWVWVLVPFQPAGFLRCTIGSFLLRQLLPPLIPWRSSSRCHGNGIPFWWQTLAQGSFGIAFERAGSGIALSSFQAPNTGLCCEGSSSHQMGPSEGAPEHPYFTLIKMPQLHLERSTSQSTTLESPQGPGANTVIVKTWEVFTKKYLKPSQSLSDLPAPESHRDCSLRVRHMAPAGTSASARSELPLSLLYYRKVHDPWGENSPVGPNRRQDRKGKTSQEISRT